MRVTDCVDAYDPPVRTIDDVERERLAREAHLRETILFKRPPRSWGRAVYSDRGERWDTMQQMADALGVDRGTGYVCVSNGVRCKGRRLSYRPFKKGAA